MRTLLIDIDPQSNASSGLGLRKRSYPKSTYDVVVHREPLTSILHDTELDALKLAPGSRELIGATMELAQEPDRHQRLASALETVRPTFPFILICLLYTSDAADERSSV